MNTQKEDENDTDSALVKDNDNTQPCERTEETKKGEKKWAQKNQNHNTIFKESPQDHNIGLILILTILKKYLWQGSLISQNTTP